MAGQRYEVNGRILRCAWCDGERFDLRRGVMDTRGFAAFDMTWMNRGCTEYICAGCGFVLTFADPA